MNLLTKRINLNLLFKHSNLTSNFALTLGCLNPALNNPDQINYCPADKYFGNQFRSPLDRNLSIG